MIINRINTSNNFGASIVGTLKEEMENKLDGDYPVHFTLSNDERTKKIANKLNGENIQKARQRVNDVDNARKTILKLGHTVMVNFNEDKTKYAITTTDGDTLEFDRSEDINSDDYSVLIRVLKHFK